MMREQWEAVDRYFGELLLCPDSALDEALRDSADAGLPAISVTPQQGKFLNLLARAMGARSILEIGTLGGYSTIWLARALPPGGRVVTLEIDSGHADVARNNIARAGISDRVELILGPALDTLPRLAADGRGPFDYIFIDADKLNYPVYLTWSLRLSRVGTAIIADNVVRDGAIANADSSDENVQAVRRFNDRLAAEPRLDATVIQTVGGKGYDGFAIAIVKEPAAT
jgi:predicted O-methyltransferase YrrM